MNMREFFIGSARDRFELPASGQKLSPLWKGTSKTVVLSLADKYLKTSPNISKLLLIIFPSLLFHCFEILKRHTHTKVSLPFCNTDRHN